MLITTRITQNDYDLEEKKIRKKNNYVGSPKVLQKTLDAYLKIMFFIFLNCSGSTPVFLYTETVIFFNNCTIFVYQSRIM